MNCTRTSQCNKEGLDHFGFCVLLCVHVAYGQWCYSVKDGVTTITVTTVVRCGTKGSVSAREREAAVTCLMRRSRLKESREMW